MPLVLRTIRKAKWYRHEGVSWLEEGELQADALGDLVTKNNELSVWIIRDDESNLEQVVAAMAATRHHLSNFDYALFDLQHLSDLNIRMQHTRGESPDEQANAWHRDLIELSASKIMQLAKIIMEEAERRRVSEKQIRRMIIRAVNADQIDRAQLAPGIASKID